VRASRLGPTLLVDLLRRHETRRIEQLGHQRLRVRSSAPRCRFTTPPTSHLGSSADGPRPWNAHPEDKPAAGQPERTSLMFMIVSYPWPVASAHVELAGIARRARGHEPQDQDQQATEPEQHRRVLISPKV
jgi:hypothetical protein